MAQSKNEPVAAVGRIGRDSTNTILGASVLADSLKDLSPKFAALGKAIPIFAAGIVGWNIGKELGLKIAEITTGFNEAAEEVAEKMKAAGVKIAESMESAVKGIQLDESIEKSSTNMLKARANVA